MREIKFRAWNAPLKKMDYSPLNAVGFDGRVYYGNADITGFFENIMQYTGLKDKNGREIWEGDVVKGIRDSHWHGGYDIVLGKVEFDEETCSFRVDGGGLLYRIEEIEVIGDVYRNPELLEAKK